MENTDKSHHPDIFNFEFQLREILDELQWKTDTLKTTQEELLQSRHFLYNLEMGLEEERRTSADIRMQLETAIEVTNRWEAERIKKQCEQAQLQINYEIIFMERNSLMDRVKIVDLENLELKQRVEELEASVVSKDSINKELQRALVKLSDRVTRVNATANSNVMKLQREHESLQRSVEAITQLNKRLQATSTCVNAMEQNYKIKIRELQNKLSSLQATNESVVKVDSTKDHETLELHLQMETTLKELKLKLESENEINKKIDAILKESTHSSQCVQVEDVKEQNNRSID